MWPRVNLENKPKFKVCIFNRLSAYPLNQLIKVGSDPPRPQVCHSNNSLTQDSRKERAGAGTAPASCAYYVPTKGLTDSRKEIG